MNLLHICHCPVSSILQKTISLGAPAPTFPIATLPVLDDLDFDNTSEGICNLSLLLLLQRGLRGISLSIISSARGRILAREIKMQYWRKQSGLRL